MDVSQPQTIEAPGLGRKIGVAWAALAWEDLWPRLMPLLAFAALFVAVAHFDLFAGLEPWTHTGLLAVLALAFAGLGLWQLRDFAWPARDAAIRRLERDSGVPHRPLVAVQDRLATGRDDPMAAALWDVHRRREVERLAGLGNKPAHPGLAALDSWALRLVPVLLLIVAVATPPAPPPPAAGRPQSGVCPPCLYRAAADLSRRQRPRQASACAGWQQTRRLRRRCARPRAAAARDRRQGDGIHHRRQGEVPGRA